MRPNWLTVAIVPAFCGALVGAGVAAALLRSSVPLQTMSSDHTTVVPSVSTSVAVPLGTASSNPATDDASKPPAQTTVAHDSPATSPSSRNKAEEDASLWWVQLIGRLAWPVTLLLALCFIAYNRRLGKILGFGTRLVKKITAGGVQIEINSEAVELVQRQLHGTFQELITDAADEYERIAEVQDVTTLVKNAIVGNVRRTSKIYEERFTSTM